MPIIPIKHNCCSILPLSFTNELSEYELLCKLTHKMNEIINLVNGQIDISLNDLINEKFNNIMLSTMYDANTETLILYIDKGGE